MIVLTGPSASGKTETAKYLMEKRGLKKVVTCTTRAPRKGELNDVDYHFLTREDFKRGIAAGEFLETAEYNGNLYGTKYADLGPDKVVCVEPHGAHSYRKALGDRMFCAYLNASEKTRLKRMIEIRKDGKEAAMQRIARDKEVFCDDENGAKCLADLIFCTDDMTIEEQADKVFEAYQKWKKERSL